MRTPTILVFDSGLGGLSVFGDVAKARPDARFVYAADNAGFPYGHLDEAALVARVLAVMGRLIERQEPDLIVVACNTASTIALPALRAHFSVPFVGTVPAIKPAAERSLTRHFAVLGTLGTVKREYTQELIRQFAQDCAVTLVGAPRLAGLAEAILRGEEVADEALASELAPCFVPRDGRAVDTIVLACTHYPLILDRLEPVAIHPVVWIDPAPAIARRVSQLLPPIPSLPTGRPVEAKAVFTGQQGLSLGLAYALAERGLPIVEMEPMPLDLTSGAPLAM
jgi:glutamate racemase